MQAEESGMMLVRADLCERLEALRRVSAVAQPSDFAWRLQSIRLIAASYGFWPVARLAEALERSARGGRGADIVYLDRMQDAVRCERQDEDASEAMLASISLRLHG